MRVADARVSVTIRVGVFDMERNCRISLARAAYADVGQMARDVCAHHWFEKDPFWGILFRLWPEGK